MKSWTALCLALAYVVLNGASAPAQGKAMRRGEPPAGRFGWVGTLQEGKAEARKTGKPLMVVVRCVP